MKLPNWKPATTRPVLSTAEQRLVHAAFESEREAIAEREDETGRAADAVGIRAALEVTEVAFEVVVAHQADRGADTDLIDRAQVVFGEYVPIRVARRFSTASCRKPFDPKMPTLPRLNR